MFLLLTSISLITGTFLTATATIKNIPWIMRVINLVVGLLFGGYAIYANFIVEPTTEVLFPVPALFIALPLLAITYMLHYGAKVPFFSPARETSEPLNDSTPAVKQKVESPAPREVINTPQPVQERQPVMVQPNTYNPPAQSPVPPVQSKPQPIQPLPVPNQTPSSTGDKLVLPDFF